MSTTALLQQALAWIDQDPDPVTRGELADLVDRVEKSDSGAQAELSDRFAGQLTFGTAGLRAEIGAGPMRMNRVVVSHAARGLGEFLLGRSSGAAVVVVIGFDARHNSDVFAKDTAEILQAMGIRAILFDQVTPTPVLAFSVRHLGADAGVMVTASHNPPADNGYKVYLGGEDQGSQIVPPADAAIHAAIMDSHAHIKATDIARATSYDIAGRELIEAYAAATVKVAESFGAAGRKDLTICYTPLHGVGGEVFTSLLATAGFTKVHTVATQASPDPDFPTVSFPNPEESGALDLAIETAQEVDADLIIAHDPDADRLAVALPNGDGWSMLSGNELGAILAATQAQRVEQAGQTGVLGYSLVSSPIAGTIAQAHGLTPTQTPTGFKWISRLPGLVFGYEEALGYLVNPDTVRDKDGISAGLFLAALAAELRNQGLTLRDELERVRNTYGGFASDQISLRFDTMVIAGEIMDQVRQSPQAVFAELGVQAVLDLRNPPEGMPPANLIQLTLRDGNRVIVRPSGTEPKLKVYLDTTAAKQSVADEAMTTLRQEVSRAIDSLVPTGGT